jgi:hypothetical protein
MEVNESMGTATGPRPKVNRRSVGSTKASHGQTASVQGPEDWDAWCAHLQTRRSPRPIDRLVPGLKTPILSWPLEDAWHGSDSEKLVKLLERFSRSAPASAGRLADRLESWLDDAPGRAADPVFAIECIAWSHALPRLAQSLHAAPWCQLHEQLVAVAEQSAGLDLQEHPLPQQMLSGELPLTLSYLFPELSASRRLGREARLKLSHGIVELLDGEGLPHAAYWDVARSLLACWCRCGFVGRETRQPAFDEDAVTQLEWFVRQSLRLARKNGSQVFTHGLAGAYCGPLFDAALDLAGDRDDRRVAALVLPRRPRVTSGKTRGESAAPPVHSEWAEAALLRRTWSATSDQLAVTYHGGQLKWELNTGNTTLWSGQGDPEIRIDSRPLKPAGGWNEVCWVSNEDGDYLEIEMEMEGGRTVQRQMLLARLDRFLFVSDVVLGEEESEIEYCHRIPLHAGVRFRPAKLTCEGHLHTKRRMAIVLPLLLPEWRNERPPGSLEQVGEYLQYQVRTRARRLYAPLFFDLSPTRQQQQLTWRRLTVAQQLEVQKTDVAAGYRVQVGKHQWLVYRSLTPPANRTLLGQNISCDFVVGRFSSGGTVDNLVEIE